MQENFTSWLLEQVPVVIVMGVGLWWITRRWSEDRSYVKTMHADALAREKNSLEILSKLSNLIERMQEKEEGERRITNELLTKIKESVDTLQTKIIRHNQEDK